MTPVRFIRDPGNERALRAANGVDLHAELATTIATCVAGVVAAFAFLGLLISSC